MFGFLSYISYIQYMKALIDRKYNVLYSFVKEYKSHLSEWELKFFKDILIAKRISVKQTNVVKRIVKNTYDKKRLLEII